MSAPSTIVPPRNHAEELPQRVICCPLEVTTALSTRARSQPTTVGIPFPKSLLRTPCEARVRLPDERTLPVQTQLQATWNDGSVKWLLADFVLPALGVGKSDLMLEIAEGDRRPTDLIRCSEGRDEFSIDTGHMIFAVDRRVCRPFAQVRKTDVAPFGWPSSSLVLTDCQGREHEARVEHSVIDTRGPLRTTICLTGSWPGCASVRFRCRLSFFVGSGLVRFDFTLHNSKRARHRGGMWDLGDAGSFHFRDLSLMIPRGPMSGPVDWSAEQNQGLKRLATGRLEIYQDSSGGENWRSRNHLNRERWIPCRFQGYQCQVGTDKGFGRRASPVVVLHEGAARLVASMPEFWQQFPKAIEVDQQALRLRLFPEQWHDRFELQGGERKTHTIWLCFGTRDDGENLDWTHQPAKVQVGPEWVAASGAIDWFCPAHHDSDDRLQQQINAGLCGPDNLFKKRETVDEYGWRNYGDVWADHEGGAHYQGPAPIISHYNNQFDVIYGALLQMLRTGDVRWRELVAPLARHVMDIDIYHTTRDKAAYNGGLFWFTDHYLDAATSTHRTYSRANQPSDGRSYGGGPGSEHNFATGLLHYYYLCGDLDARDAVVGLADWVINMDDGSRTLLGVVDRGPTGLASLCGTLGSSSAGRGAGNSISTLLDGWMLTSENRYLLKAEELIRRCIHPDDDVAAQHLLDAERHWSYTMFLTALLRYLDVKAEAGQLDKMYAYAQRSVVRYGQWMAEFERPYLDHPEELEFVTEAWAAQEFRKANVLRLASRHADGALADAMWHKGQQLADRAWQDLLGFKTAHYTRAIAVLMTEGSRDAYLRTIRPSAAPRCSVEYQFAPRLEFRTQKERVFSKLKSVRGIASLAAAFFWPRRTEHDIEWNLGDPFTKCRDQSSG